MVSIHTIKINFSGIERASHEIKSEDKFYETNEGFKFADSQPPGGHEIDLHEFYEKLKSQNRMKKDVKNNVSIAVNQLAKQRYSGIFGIVRKAFDSIANFFRGEGFHSDEYLATKAIREIKEEETGISNLLGKVKGKVNEVLAAGRADELVNKVVNSFKGPNIIKAQFANIFQEIIEKMDPSSIENKGNIFSIKPKNKNFSNEYGEFTLGKEVILTLIPDGNKIKVSGLKVSGKHENALVNFFASKMGGEPEYFRLEDNKVLMKLKGIPAEVQIASAERE